MNNFRNAIKLENLKAYKRKLMLQTLVNTTILILSASILGLLLAVGYVHGGLHFLFN